jgi:hypothetical protein
LTCKFSFHICLFSALTIDFFHAAICFYNIEPHNLHYILNVSSFWLSELAFYGVYGKNVGDGKRVGYRWEGESCCEGWKKRVSLRNGDCGRYRVEERKPGRGADVGGGMGGFATQWAPWLSGDPKLFETHHHHIYCQSNFHHQIQRQKNWVQSQSRREGVPVANMAVLVRKGVGVLYIP